MAVYCMLLFNWKVFTHLHSDGFEEYFLCALVLLRHEQAVALVHESLGIVPVVPDCHIGV